ncbi:spermatogenesis-associated protein 45 isoform X2 [Anarrhichthys ocellatus]|uniref:spermatogenesis-associated protein 45 isoform X2 n=1 Tax=Anarrhichthys ocellatus TaxID=433405 RepID=UPI0012EE3878|nr:spermatogenesis-associated protein 45-like isoform X2 [Anarrhichthys ocellatus]
MSGAEQRTLLERNMTRETWCRVEVNPQQYRERAERRHYRSHLRTSPDLLAALTGGSQRASARIEWPTASKLAERKHFEDSSIKAM